MESNLDHARELVALQFLHSFLPIIAATYYVGASIVRSIRAHKNNESISQDQKWLRITLGCIMVLVLATYVGDSVILILASISKAVISPPQHFIIFALASGLLWFSILLMCIDSQSPPGYPLYGYCLIYFVFEVALLSLSILLGIPRTGEPNGKRAIQGIRLFLFSLVPCVAFGFLLLTTKSIDGDEESAPLLSDTMNVTPSTENTYGACDNSSDAGAPQPSKKDTTLFDEDDEEELNAADVDLWAFVSNLYVLAPFFWPSKKLKLKLCFVGVGICLAFARIINILIPIQIGLITNILSQNNGVFPWKNVTVLIALRLLDSSGGLPSAMKFMWMPLENFAYMNLSTTAYNHVMTLSSDYHDSKNCGSLWQVVFRGQNVKDMVTNLCFHIGPMIIDLALAVSVLYYLFDAYMALDVAAVSVLFLWSSGKILAKQAGQRKEYIIHRSKEFTHLCETTANWHTVSYFNHIPYEKSRYLSRVQDHLAALFKFVFWGRIENIVQSLALILGLSVACFMAIYQVVKGYKPVGSFIMLLSYWGQLSGPLQFIAGGFNNLAMDMVDMEEYLKLLKQKPTITDRPHAQPLHFDQSDIEFVDVSFSYDGKREVLKNVNFKAKSGQTTALVGQTGGGKTTILKLLGRFYDPTSGSVRIGGQDISHVILESLRANLGFVPQSPALFHDTIINNIRYARLGATDDEIIEACKAVALHDRILSFTEGYQTLVGERGVKLSGGELQRVAIARAIIQNPKIVLLDEATSAVDSETEAFVQESLRRLSEGRTTFIIAHRLSTVINADKILVVADGTIVEEGNHAELLEKRGRYHRLWAFQGAFHNPKSKHEQTGILINDLDNKGSVIREDFPEDGKDIASSRSGDNAGEALDNSRKQGREPLSQKNPNSESGVSTNNPFSKKIWKPDAPEFVPRAHQSPRPSVLDVVPTQTNGTNHCFPSGAASLNLSKENVPPPGSTDSSLNDQMKNEDRETISLPSKKQMALGQPGLKDVRSAELEQEPATQDPTEINSPRFASLQNSTQRRRELTKSEPTGLGKSTSQGGDETSSLVDSETTKPATQHKKGQSTANQRRRRRNRNGNSSNDNPEQGNSKTSPDCTRSSSY
ncbi:hypothetical protein GX48_00285 [Paracoccidioides brasiliensis]|nr:hypothetical protein GX48_00285 [Paracoccidioides brasiliensis]